MWLSLPFCCIRARCCSRHDEEKEGSAGVDVECSWWFFSLDMLLRVNLVWILSGSVFWLRGAVM